MGNHLLKMSFKVYKTRFLMIFERFSWVLKRFDAFQNEKTFIDTWSKEKNLIKIETFQNYIKKKYGWIDVGDQTCWGHVRDVGDKSSHQYNDVTNMISIVRRRSLFFTSLAVNFVKLKWFLNNRIHIITC